LAAAFAFGFDKKLDTFVTSAGRRRGYLLSRGQFTFIDCPGSTSTDADGLNSERDIVGGCVDVEGHHAYVMTK